MRFLSSLTLTGPVALFALVSIASAQVSDANLTGIVRDPAALVISGAQVDLVNIETHVRRSTQSGAEGVYRFTSVPAGKYEIRVSAPGLAAFQVSGLELESGRNHTFNATLAIEDTKTQVSVAASTETVDTTTPTRQDVLSRTEITGLPFTGSGSTGVLNMSLLSSGVGSGGGLGFGVGPSIGGQRPSSNGFLLEGMDINDRVSTGPVLTVSNEAVMELTVQKNQFSSEFGSYSAGQFNTILMTGSNSFHGSAYEYLQNAHLNAVDESFRRQQISQNPRLDQNRYGMSAGGKIIPDRLFYFANVEGQSLGLAAASAGAAFAPTADGFAKLKQIPGISLTNLNAFQSAISVPTSAAGTRTVAGQSIPVGIVNTTGPSYNNNVRGMLSVDYTLSARSEIRGRYALLRADSIDNSTTLPQFYTPVDTKTDVASVAHLFTLSPRALNELRLGLMRSGENRPVGKGVFPGLDSYPSIDIDDLGIGVGAFVIYPQANRSNTIQISDALGYTRGTHALKFGYQGARYQSAFAVAQYQRGYYEYSSLERFLMDITPENGLRSVGSVPYNGNSFNHALFAQDEWRVRPNLVINAGVRYELTTIPEGARRQVWNSLASVPGVLEFNSPANQYLNFAPRVGLAWSPGTSGRTAIRAGWGINYDSAPQNIWINSAAPQFYTLVQAQAEKPDAPNFLANGAIPGTPRSITDAASARAATSAWIPGMERPYAIQWNGGVQRSIGRDYKVDVEYIGTRGVHLPVQMQINRQAGATVDRSLPTWFTMPDAATIESASLTLANLKAVNTLSSYGFSRTITSYMPRGNSSYHGLATSVSRRYNNGFQFNAAFTWSHNIDDSTAVVSSTLLSPRRPQDFFDLRAERATSMLDRRHRFTGAWLYDTDAFRMSNPFLRAIVHHWNVSGIWTSESGTPSTVRSGIDSNMNGDSVADRTVINTNGDPSRSTTVTAVRNSAGAVVGYVARDPNAMYVQGGQGTRPNAARNTLLLPGIENLDLAVARRVRLTERANLEFRAEAYNALNHAQFVPGFTNSVDVRPRVSPASNSMLIAGNALFNRPDLAFESNSRTLQLVLRLKF